MNDDAPIYLHVPSVNFDDTSELVGDSTFTAEYLRGIQGNKGDSAYDIAVKNGFIGTEAEWLLSLNSPIYMPPVVEPLSERMKILPDLYMNNSYFGGAVAIQGTTLVVGAPGYFNIANGDIGALLIYTVIDNELSTPIVMLPPATAPWGLGTFVSLSTDSNVILSSDGEHVVRYDRVNGVWEDGVYTAISLDHTAMGVSKNGEILCLAVGNVVKVYKYGSSGYYNTIDLSPNLFLPSDTELFFSIVDLMIVIGAPKTLINNISTGAVIVYYEENGSVTEGVTLTAPDNLEDNNFGKGVALSTNQNYLAVASDTGIYVYEKVNGIIGLGTKLVASDPTINDAGYGKAIAISGDGSIIVASAPMDINSYGYQAGAAIVFKRDGTEWTEEKILRSPKSASNDRLGSTVALSDDGSKIILGSPDDYVTGSVYLFE